MSSTATVVSLKRRGHDALGYGPLRVWLAIREREERGQLLPTVRELCAVIGISIKDVVERLRKLRRAGLIAYEDGRARTIRTTARLELLDGGGD